MQERKKGTIVIASVLKPLDDTRMFEKMAVSLAQTNKCHVHIVGWGIKIPPTQSGISFHKLGSFTRLSVLRLLAPIKLLKVLATVRPEKLIITTHELIWAAVIARLFFGVKIYYDIRENYYMNILHTNAFIRPLRQLIATYVRGKEWLASPFIDQFFLAEKCYKDELPFIGHRWTILENKSLHFKPASPRPPGLHLLFSGTLDESTGVFEAIRLAQQLYCIEPTTNLTIIGYAARIQVQKRLRKISNTNEFIQLKGIDRLVPHSQILEAIKLANAGIIFYTPSPHTENRIPTKLYEYLSLELPVIHDKNANWRALLEKWNAGIEIDFTTPDVVSLRDKINLNNFYPNQPNDTTWFSEAEKLIAKII